MVQPTPFERHLQEVAQQAAKDPAAAFARLDDLYGKSLTESDVQNLGGLAVHLGAAGLGRYDDTVRFARRLLTHAAVTPDAAVARSLWRGMAVALTCAGNHEEAANACARGVTTPAERLRLAIMTAQTLAARNRAAEAVPFLKQAEEICAEVPGDDKAVADTAAISVTLARAAEQHVRQVQAVFVATARTAAAAFARHGDWRSRHRSLYLLGKAWLAAADPAQALNVVQRMMEIEDASGGGPDERFHTAALACRAQTIRGQAKIAGAALEACQDFARRITDAPPPAAGGTRTGVVRDRAGFVRDTLAELETLVTVLKHGG